ncbi:transcription initiation factor IIB [Candidatus Bathyarchaeota archaeon]|nr:transcription initiation factor IIB [Candidatus Bathyarchaeota archaeon]
MSQQTSEGKHECTICGSSDTINDVATGEKICRECGYVYQDNKLDMGPEWRAFTLQERKDKPRTGAPLTHLMHDKGLSTKIGYRNRDHAGRKLDQDQKSKYYRLRKRDNRTKRSGSHSRNLSRALSFISNLGNELGLPRSVLETGAVTYKQVLKKDGVKGRTINGISAVSLYMACRVCKVSKSLTKISEIAKIPRKTLARNYRYVYNLLDKDIPRVSTGRIISKLVKQLRLSGKVETLGLELYTVVSDEKLTSGKSPRGIAAAVVYIGSIIMDEKRTQQTIAEKARVTSVTIRNRYKDIVEHIELIINI